MAGTGRLTDKSLVVSHHSLLHAVLLHHADATTDSFCDIDAGPDFAPINASEV